MRVTQVPIIPAGWTETTFDGQPVLYRLAPNGLRATFSREIYDHPDPAHPDGFYTGPGVYRRVVLSRKNMYPTWDEMKQFIYSCGLFDHTRAVVMILPPPGEYLNCHPNAFHFFQREREGQL